MSLATEFCDEMDPKSCEKEDFDNIIPNNRNHPISKAAIHSYRCLKKIADFWSIGIIIAFNYQNNSVLFFTKKDF